jgi:HAD superfamily hydrolase (TIGR01549 family)
MSKIKAVVFDFDGTIVDTFEHNIRALEMTLASRNLHYSREELRAIMGMLLVEIYEKLAPGEDAELLTRQHQATQETPELFELIAEYEGLRELIEELQGQHIKLAIQTNRSRASLQLILDHLELEPFFDCIITPQDITHPKPHEEGILKIAKILRVQPAEMMMVGDSHFDILAGKTAKTAATVGLTHGFGKREELEAAGADYIIDSLAELPRLVQAS